MTARRTKDKNDRTRPDDQGQRAEPETGNRTVTDDQGQRAEPDSE